mmetsp:Transcript_41149/g.129241  ORF Transcript_41149/g.129241 Transcript_41149/m.129241 type:complete len:202 (-) Transcript_41149:1486-2091(-)
MLLAPGEHRLLVWNDDSDEGGLERVAVDPRLEDEAGGGDNRLDALDGDVLALRQLEDVLLPVDDAQAPVQVPLPDVPRMQPAVSIEHRCCLTLELVVALHDVPPPHADLSSRQLLAGHGRVEASLEGHLLLKLFSRPRVHVLRAVLHLRHIYQLHLRAWQRSSDGSYCREQGRHGDSCSRVLRHAVALNDGGVERDLEEAM